MMTIKTGDSFGQTVHTNCLIGSTLPHFELHDLREEKIILNKNSKFTIYNLWFETCAPCVAEMPGLNRLKKDFTNNNYISIGTDSKIDIINFLKSHKYDFTHAVNGKKIIEKYLFGAGYPNTIVVDNKNIIRDIIVGGAIDSTAADNIYYRLSVYH
jgi:cytochrome c biogenesis protein CcmG, thiol:disulfide interchange protein DsbE